MNKLSLLQLLYLRNTLHEQLEKIDYTQDNSDMESNALLKMITALNNKISKKMGVNQSA